MQTKSEPISGMKAMLLEEAQTVLFVFIYLALLLGALATYRRLVLAEYGIGYFQYGSSLVEALVLSKVIVLGHSMGLGERFRDAPLIVPTLYKTLWFSLFLFAFGILEHLVGGWLRGKSTDRIVAEFLALGLPEILARTLVKILALLPLLAAWEIGRVLGKGRLFDLFLKRGARGESDAGSEAGSATQHAV